MIINFLYTLLFIQSFLIKSFIIYNILKKYSLKNDIKMSVLRKILISMIVSFLFLLLLKYVWIIFSFVILSLFFKNDIIVYEIYENFIEKILKLII